MTRALEPEPELVQISQQLKQKVGPSYFFVSTFEAIFESTNEATERQLLVSFFQSDSFFFILDGQKEARKSIAPKWCSQQLNYHHPIPPSLICCCSCIQHLFHTILFSPTKHYHRTGLWWRYSGQHPVLLLQLFEFKSCRRLNFLALHLEKTKINENEAGVAL